MDRSSPQNDDIHSIPSSPFQHNKLEFKEKNKDFWKKNY